MSAHPLRRERHNLTPLITVSSAALVFAILLVLVRLQWAPLESADRGAANHLNALVAGHSVLVSAIKGITWLGSDGVLWVVILGATIVLAVRRRWRLAVYLLATGAGAIVLDPILKSLVGRLRPVVADPIAHGTGSSFPSGHSLGSIVCYGALFLVFVPATRGRWRTVFTSVVVALVAVIGISRLLLGVHYLSDVIGAWAIGVTWLGLTAFAFELTRHAAGQPVTAPITEGLEPEAKADLQLAERQTPATRAAGHPGRVAAAVGVCWVLIVGIIVGVGELLTRYGDGNVLGDHTVPHWLAARRSSGWTWWSALFSSLGSTIPIQLVILTTSIVFLARYRRWRPAIFMFTLILGELFAFLITEFVVKRPRPDVHNMDAHLPTSAYPSGHVAATTCVYVGLAILVLGHTRGWWRWLFLALAVIMPICVIASRLYRGEHHPTDVIGSLIFAALWLTAATRLIRPNHDVGAHVAAAGQEPNLHVSAADTFP
jgi:undecaprenyl-diphosphatase